MQKEHFMRQALLLAKKAALYDEVPVGAIVVCKDKIIAKAYNTKNKNQNALLHAEMSALQKAQKKLGTWHLEECEMYVTLEPCAMCAGACINTRLGAMYFGAYDPKAGCCGTLYNLPSDNRFNHRPKVEGGILEAECGKILSDFFKKKRIKEK